ncbi:flavin reductase family protein [Nocardia arthritidis]|uniref:Oxidoreductase n=1 Tax=Nocardia arthritidis TaxID=228602 RepID=A0A6G9YFE2_9NOCA|nr:flavin reductase family protein [Nocardia arthritidis]QIS11850.1 oxidoreductase [Nocardia arthritidis]
MGSQEPTAAVRDAFDAVVAAADFPMWIVTAAADEDKAGCLVGFTAQASIEPPRFLVGLSKNNYTFGVAARADHLAVHLISRRNVALARLFGGESGVEVDKFTHCQWRYGPYGVPVLAAAAGWFVGEVVHRTDFGDHVGTLLAPVAASAPASARTALRYHAVAHISPGQPA